MRIKVRIIKFQFRLILKNSVQEQRANMKHFEVNFDGLVGPTHNYAGLSFGNVASLSNARSVSSPRSAAKQGLKKNEDFARNGNGARCTRPTKSVLIFMHFAGSVLPVVTPKYSRKQRKRHLQYFKLVAQLQVCGQQMLQLFHPAQTRMMGECIFTPANLTNKFHRSP